MNCPVCDFDLSILSEYESTAHVNSHFAQDQQDELEVDFELLELQKKYGVVSKCSRQAEMRKVIEKDLNKNFINQHQYNARLTILDRAVNEGVNPEYSCTQNIVSELEGQVSQMHLKAQNLGYGARPIPLAQQRFVFSRECDLFSTTQGEHGCCGFKNLQMLLSAMMREPDFLEVVFNGRPVMPSIWKLQRMIEEAWHNGFDRAGAEQLQFQLWDTDKWIGPTEIVTLLNFLWVRCRLVEFRHADVATGTHPRMFEWVRDYFTRASVSSTVDDGDDCDGDDAENKKKRKEKSSSKSTSSSALTSQTVQSNLAKQHCDDDAHNIGDDGVCDGKARRKFPLYFQNPNHSRLIVGTEITGSAMVVLDPGIPLNAVRKALRSPPTYLERCRKTQTQEKRAQYQFVEILGLIRDSDEYERVKRAPEILLIT